MTSDTNAVFADRLMAQAGKTFYRAARLLPRSVRGNVIRLYAFCRLVDDLADEPGVPMPERRRSLGTLAEAFSRGNLIDLRAAGWPFAGQGVMAEAAGLLVGAAAQDLEQTQPRTREELLAYAFGVAGTVGIMMAHVLQADPSGLRAAVALGMAMQLSNIARDVAEDLGNGRVYLPSEWVSSDQVYQALRAAKPEDSATAGGMVQAATGQVLALAETLYESAFDGIRSLPWRIRWSILAAALCYREIGREVGRRGSLSWTRRVVVSNRHKFWLIACAGLRLLLPRYWRSGRERVNSVPGHDILFTPHELRAA